MNHFIGIDQGTTMTTALVVDDVGAIVGQASAPLAQHYPQPGWVEHDANEILELTVQVLQEAIADAGLAATDITAIGIANQRETLTFWDKNTGEPSAPAIVWQDRRTLPLCEELIAEDGEGILDHTGSAIVPNAAGTKIAWQLENNDEIRRGVEEGRLVCGTVDSWLAWKLTGGAVHATDRSNASVTLLMDARTREYSPRMLERMGIPESILPALVDTAGYLGHTNATLTGAAIPLTALAGDQTAAALGQGCIETGMVKNTYGTGSFLVLNVGSEYVSPTTGVMAPVLWTMPDKVDYGLEGYADASGAAVQWLRESLGLGSADEVEALAATVVDNGGVYFVPSFAGLGSPHFDSYARGTILGLTRGSTPGHIARAAYEAMAHQVCDALQEIQRTSGTQAKVIRADGGGAHSNLLMQLQADLLGIPVERPVVTETTAYGAALLAGVGAGAIQGLQAASDRWALDHRFEPQLAEDERRKQRARWQKAIEHARGWLRD